ncbi:hypothetical protein CBER1_05047 [Cercospora berteroae]|uniref:Lysine-specific metallo-endopeptidase domain-containing protein n=1 Tax=Cercospora berteroae TaxID=357750 RepID=A0A2S6BRJ8_9PEZI|nr:hypothetical protein CBER1_05047 [Cercospora berteroae]
MYLHTNLLIRIILTIASAVSAYQIHSSCNGMNFNVQAAVDEAKAIAEYAEFRMRENRPALGDIVKELLGSGNQGRTKFRDNMNNVESGFGPYTGQWSAGNTNDPTIVIRCDASHLAAFPLPQQPNGYTPTLFEDRDFPNMPKLADGPNNLATGPSHVIVICAGVNDASRNKVTGTQDTWRTRDWSNVQFLDFDQYLSFTLLHEIMHVSNPGLTDTLASGRAEAYGWHDINGLATNADKQSNADSYALLATALYMKRHTISANSGSFGRRHAVGNRPNDSPNDGHL